MRSLVLLYLLPALAHADASLGSTGAAASVSGFPEDLPDELIGVEAANVVRFRERLYRLPSPEGMSEVHACDVSVGSLAGTVSWTFESVRVVDGVGSARWRNEPGQTTATDLQRTLWKTLQATSSCDAARTAVKSARAWKSLGKHVVTRDQSLLERLSHDAPPTWRGVDRLHRYELGELVIFGGYHARDKKVTVWVWMPKSEAE